MVKSIEDAVSSALEIDDRHMEWTTHRGLRPVAPRVELSLSLEGKAGMGEHCHAALGRGTNGSSRRAAHLYTGDAS